MENKNVIIVGIIVLITVAVTAFLFGRQSATGAAAIATNEGFSSYDEMMAAHHPAQGRKQQSEGCDGVASAGSTNSVSYAGQKSVYGLTYDNTGYEQLVDAAKKIKLNDAQSMIIKGLDVQMPCCGFKELQLSGNCECGHHVALFGLAKLLASQNYQKGEIQLEINKWKEIFYPNSAGSSTGACG